MSKSKYPGLGKRSQRLKKGLRKKDLLDRIEELERRLADLEKGSNPRPKRPEYPTIPGPYRHGHTRDHVMNGTQIFHGAIQNILNDTFFQSSL